MPTILNQIDAAAYLGIPRHTLRNRLDRGRWPKATHPLWPGAKWKGWTKAELRRACKDNHWAGPVKKVEEISK